ncbi:MAG: tetratricopeptide repeat protein [Gemmatimonadetes bacterium]|nr:tetratricopeptide repeat protein [Gemmatimonadota bacterium]
MTARSLVRELMGRRVPHILAIYLGASWAMVQFVAFLEGRYLLSPHLTDLALFGLALLVPSVVLYSYNHGRAGPDHWVRSEVIGIPANLAIAVGVLFFSFSGKDLGAVTRTIQLKDEQGQSIQRVVPKSAYRKRLALFNFDAEAADTSVHWLRYALPLALGADLGQDLFLNVQTSYPSFRDKLRRAGYPEEVGVPLTLKREISEQAHLPYFVSGSVARADGQLRVRLALHDTETGKLLNERTFNGADFLSLVDKMSVDLRRDLSVPEGHVEKSQDLPVAEILTQSLPAFRLFADASVAFGVRDEWPAAARLLEQAVAADPKFALALYTLGGVYLVANQAQKALPALQAAMDHIYRLPERWQFDLKRDYYFVRQQGEKAYAVAKMKTELFPDDVQAYATLAMMQVFRDEKDAAIASLQRLLELDPTQYEWIPRIGSLYERKGDFVQALEWFERYARQFPENPEAFTPLGRLYRLQGEHARAKEYYEKALLLDPGKVDILLSLARIEQDLDNFDAALRQYEEALTIAKTAEDRHAAHAAVSAYYELRGQMRRAIEHWELSLSEAQKSQPPFVVVSQRLGELGKYVKAGRTQEALAILESARRELAPPMDAFVPYGELDLYLELEQPDKIEQTLPATERLITGFGFKFVEPFLVYARGRVRELRGEYAEAIRHYEQELKLNPTDATIHAQLARCYRELGQVKKAEELFAKTLKVLPAHPRTHYELALLYAKTGDRARALQHLNRALEVWKDADPSFKWAQEARKKLVELQAAAA